MRNLTLIILLSLAFTAGAQTVKLRLYGDNTLKRANIRTAVELFIDKFSFVVGGI